MAEQDRLETLREALAEVLNIQAFMFAEPGDVEELDAPDEDCIGVTIGFTGAASGAITLVCPRSLSAELAANILGTQEEELEGGEAEDAFKELLNIACGQFLTRHFGTEPVFSLSIPEVQSIAADAWEDWSQRADVRGLEVDFTPMLLQLQLECAN